MSTTNDNSPFQARLWMLADRYANRWPVRACGRALAGSVPVGALVGSLADVPDELPGSSDRHRSIWALPELRRCRSCCSCCWVGKKHGGIVAAIKLTGLSYVFWSCVGGRGACRMARRGHGWRARHGADRLQCGAGGRAVHSVQHHAAPPRSRFLTEGARR